MGDSVILLSGGSRRSMVGIWCVWGCCGSPMVMKNLVSSFALSLGVLLFGSLICGKIVGSLFFFVWLKALHISLGLLVVWRGAMMFANDCCLASLIAFLVTDACLLYLLRLWSVGLVFHLCQRYLFFLICSKTWGVYHGM